MKRSVMNELIAWRNSPKRLPIVVDGARQVGKTYIIEKFGKTQYDNLVRINFDNDEVAKVIFEKNLDINRIIMELEAHTGQKITKGQTLLFFDEIQNAPRVLSSLKYFAEDEPDYHVVAAGSLLGVAINREKYSFPVGKVKSIRLHPFSFNEFLQSQNEDKLLEMIQMHSNTLEQLSEPLHIKALELFKKYMIIGGLPASINVFNESGSLLDVSPVLEQINSDYIADMAKYATNSETVKIRATYNSIPDQLAKENKRFQYKIAAPGGNAQKFGTAIQWLEYAGLVLKCTKVVDAQIPLKVYEDLASFKLYCNDIGLISLMSNTPQSAILNLDRIDNTFLGALAENYVAIALNLFGHRLEYWESKATAEVDFLLQIGEEVLPLEVKKGIRSKSKSLGVFRSTYNPKTSVRVSSKNFGGVDGLSAIPLYALESWLTALGELRPDYE